MRVDVRAAREQEIPRIQEIGAVDPIPDDVARRAIDEGRLLVAETKAGIVGFVYLTRIGGELCVGHVAVERGFGRRGVGTTLMREVISAARRAREPSIVLNTERDVGWNRPWYERLGFVVIPSEQWTPALEAVAAAQSRAGLDWGARVHMRLDLRVDLGHGTRTRRPTRA